MNVKKFGPGFVYLMYAKDMNLYKIGQSINPHKRLMQLNYESPCTVSLIHQMPVTNMIAAEYYFHVLFNKKRVKGEWFALNDLEVSIFKGCTGGNDFEKAKQVVIDQEYHQKRVKNV